MDIKNCEFLSESLIGGITKFCRKFPYVYNNGTDYRFLPCEAISFSKCPYKRQMLTKNELKNLREYEKNKQVSIK